VTFDAMSLVPGIESPQVPQRHGRLQRNNSVAEGGQLLVVGEANDRVGGPIRLKSHQPFDERR